MARRTVRSNCFADARLAFRTDASTSGPTSDSTRPRNRSKPSTRALMVTVAGPEDRHHGAEFIDGEGGHFERPPQPDEPPIGVQRRAVAVQPDRDLDRLDPGDTLV